MGERVVVSVVILVMIMFLVVFMVEMFVPLSANLDFRDICRNYLMSMEFNSGLSILHVNELEQELMDNGFIDISINAPITAKFGSIMELQVQANYAMSSIIALFTRSKREFVMEYKRKVIARKAIN